MKLKMSKMAFGLLLIAATSWGQGTKLDTATIDEITGLKGKMNDEEGVFKVSSPRTDIKISVDKWQMPPFMGLTSWAAFKSGMHGAMVMGDVVLMQDEVNPVMSAAFENGLEVTALHNHFFFDDPKVYFMHIGGMGAEGKLAAAVGKVFARIKETAGDQEKRSSANLDPAQTSLDAQKIEE